jgi:hypothetical protein
MPRTPQYSRLTRRLCLAALAASLLALPLWSRLSPDQSEVDIRELAEKAPLIFRGRVLGIQPDPNYRINNQPVDTAFIATIQIDRVYRGQLTDPALLHFRFNNRLLDGHECIDFKPEQNWLIFAAEKDDSLELFDDCIGALGISSLLGPDVNPSDWLSQMEADYIAGLNDPDEKSRIFSIQRLGGLQLASSRAALHEIIDHHPGIEAKWAVYAALRTGDVTVLPAVKNYLISQKYDWAETDMMFELQHVKDPAALPDLLDIFDTASSDLARHTILNTVVDNFKDPRAIPTLVRSLSFSDPAIRYLGLAGLQNITHVPACAIDRSGTEDQEVVYQREEAACKAWWDQEKQHQP